MENVSLSYAKRAVIALLIVGSAAWLLNGVPHAQAVAAKPAASSRATVHPTALQRADVSIEISQNTGLSEGDILSFYVDVHNGGPSDAGRVTARVSIPRGLIFVPKLSSTNCRKSGSRILCSIPSIQQGSTAGSKVSFQTPQALPCPTRIRLQAQAITSTSDPDRRNNATTFVTEVGCSENTRDSVDMAVELHGPATVQPSDAITYTVTTHNEGVVTATDVVVVTDVPNGLSFSRTQSSPGCTLSTNSKTVSCVISTMQGGTSKAFDIAFSQRSGASVCIGRSYKTQATIFAEQEDINESNDDSDVVTTTVNCTATAGADLSIEKTGPASIKAGDVGAYTIIVYNKNGHVAKNVRITDMGHARLNFQNAIAPNAQCGVAADGDGWECIVPSIAPYGLYTMQVFYHPAAQQNCGQQYQIYATVSSDNDPNPVNNKTTPLPVSIYCDAQAAATDLSTDVVGAIDIQPNTVSFYIATVRNLGTQAATNVLLNVHVPRSFSIQNTSACNQIGGNVVQCSFPSVQPGASRSVNVQFLASMAGCTQDAREMVVTRVLSQSADPVSANNSSSLSTIVRCTPPPSPSADLFVNLSPSHSPVVMGNTFTLAATVQSTIGSPMATNVRVYIGLSHGMTFDPISLANCRLNDAQNAECTFGQFPGNTTQSMPFTVAVTAAACSPQIPLSADITVRADNDGRDPRPQNNHFSRMISLTCPQAGSTGNLYVTKSPAFSQPHMLLGGTLGDELLRLSFKADVGEDIEVTKLAFTAIDANVSAFFTNVDRLELYKVGAVTPFANATIAACGNQFAGSMCADLQSQQLVIPRGQEILIVARPRVRSDIDGAVSGQQFALGVLPMQPSAIRARGRTSGTDLAHNNGNGVAEREVFIGTSFPGQNGAIQGHPNTVVMSRISHMANADINAHGTAIPGPRADVAIGQFTLSAPANGNFKNGVNRPKVLGLVLNVNATNVELNTGDQTSFATSDFFLFNSADPTLKAPCTANATRATGNFTVMCSDLDAVGLQTSLDAGSDITLVLEADIANAKIVASSSSTLHVSLQQYAFHQHGSFGHNASHILWTDTDAGSSTTYYWFEHAANLVNGTLYQN